MNTTTINFETSGLASRDSAIKKRNTIIEEVNKGNHVIIDFTNVNSLSGSYADELFGMLFQIFGMDWLIKNITVKHIDSFIQKTILDVIDYRKKIIKSKQEEYTKEYIDAIKSGKLYNELRKKEFIYTI